MKVYILVDENKIVRCIASEEVNLHDDKLHMDKHYVEWGGRGGDEYDVATDTWTPRIENYGEPSQTELDEMKIQTEVRDQAIQSLIGKGELPPDYTDTKG